jgi:hypothetical protein
MLTQLHTAIQHLLHQRGRIPPDEVDIRFEIPTRQWVDSLTRPTVSLYLFDLAENFDLRQTNVQTARANGHAIHRMPPRRFDLRYMVSAISTAVADEHLLLWRALVTLLRYPQLPPELLPEPLATAQPPLAAQVARAGEDTKLLDVWSALDLPPRPALLYVVTTPVELEIAFESPLVLTSTVRTTRSTGDAEPEASVRIGGIVRGKADEPAVGVTVGVEGRAAASVTDERGQFRLAALPSGKVRLRIERAGGQPQLVTVDIPSDSYDITLD